MKKGKKQLVHRIVFGVLAALFLVFNVAIYVAFDYLTKVTNNMGLKLDSVEAESVRAEATEFTKEITREGMVLLRNKDNALPLPAGSAVNLFGWSSTQMIIGGNGGSGGVSSASVNIKSSLEAAGFSVNEDLYSMYQSYKDARDIVPEEEYGGYSPSWATPEPAISDSAYYTKELLDGARSFSDIAAMTISRSSGEGLDIPAGYLSLTQDEKDILKYLRDNYKTVIVLVNSNAAMELGYLEEIDVDAAIFMPGTGDVGATALGEILAGTVNPSGRLVDTFAYDHTSSPNYYHANRPGTMEYSDMDGYYYVDYVEGIYLGYKYYETAAQEGFIDYDQTVQYPFGYGLSYTTFSKEVEKVDGDLNSDEIVISVKVTNTGSVAGKEVVQVYATPEYYSGGIEKAYVDLVGFNKSGLLQPGESETVTVTVSPFEIASYDWNDANGDGRTGYVLERGAYQLKIMDNSHELSTVAAEFNLNRDIFFEDDPVTGMPIMNLFDEAAGGGESEQIVYLSRADFAGTFPKPAAGNTGRAASEAVKAASKITVEDDPNAVPVVTGAKNGLTLDDVVGLDYDDPKWDDLLDQLSLADMESIVTNGAFGTSELESIGMKATVHADGPQGVSAWMFGVSGTSYPVQMYVAQTWNPEIAREQGRLFAEECRTSNVSAMYAPAVNLHRTPYSGRNFEYYSEDGFLSGKMAASVVYAAREGGVFMFIKHFGLNDQETFRGEKFTSLFTWSNEQAIREVFLKPFELAVKEGRTTAIMTSFNRVGSKWTGSNKALVTDLLRTEWGFRGMTITDLFMTGNNEWWMDLEQGVRAGQDLWLTLFVTPGELQIDETNPTAQQAMREAIHHIAYTVAQCEVSPQEPQPNWFYHLALPIDIVWGVGLVVYLVFLIRKPKSQPQEPQKEA